MERGTYLPPLFSSNIVDRYFDQGWHAINIIRMGNAKSDVHDSPVADHLPKYASPEIKRANVKKEGEKLMNDHINC